MLLLNRDCDLIKGGNRLRIKTSEGKLFLSNLYQRAKNSSLYNNAFFLMLNSACTSILGFVFWFIMARCFLSSDVGVGSALNAASGLISSLAGLGLGIGLIRFIPELKDDSARFINSSLTLAGTVAMVGAVIYLVGVEYWAPDLEFVRNNYLFAGFFVIFTISTVLSGLVVASLIAARTSQYVFWKSLIANLLKLPLPVLVFAQLKGYGIYAGAGTGVLVALLVALLFFLPKVYDGYLPRPAWSWNLLKKALPFSFSNYLSELLNSAPFFIYPLMVLNILGSEQNAYFSMAWMIAMVLRVIPGSLGQSFFAEGSHNPGQIGGGDGRRAFLVSILLTIPAVAVIVLLGGWILSFFGLDYAEYGIWTLRFLSLSTIPLCVNSFYLNVNQVKKRIQLIILQNAYLAVTSLGLGYLLLCKIGVIGIGIAYTFAHLSWAVIVFWPLWKELNGRCLDKRRQFSQ